MDKSTTFFKWNSFEKAREDDTHFFLYQTDVQAVILKKVATISRNTKKIY
ncbi:YcxB family protein [Bacillaceae bacterium Marseille-Q3522]|nr:YcxB family protein [Bacillaceae bacterium Marseille-Q3522]